MYYRKLKVGLDISIHGETAFTNELDVDKTHTLYPPATEDVFGTYRSPNPPVPSVISHPEQTQVDTI